MKLIKWLIAVGVLFFVQAVFSNTGFAQKKPLFLTKSQALEDLNWLRVSLEYVHPRLYKYDDKKTVNARFDSLNNLFADSVLGLDLLAAITKVNATVRCGHLNTIAQGDLGDEMLTKKVLPFYVRIVDGKYFLFNDCSDSSIPNGSRILSINGKRDTAIFHAMLQGIPADGYIQTRKVKLAERYFFYTFQGFDLYYYLFADRNNVFKIDYVSLGTNLKKSATIKGISANERKQILFRKYNIDEESWLKTPSPKFLIDNKNNYALLTVSRSFYDKKIDPDFDSLLLSAFHSIKEKGVNNLIIDLRNNEGSSEYQQMELMSYLYDKPFKLYENIYLSHLDFRPLKPVIVERDTAALLFNNDDEYMRKINDDLWVNNYEYSDNLKLKIPKSDVYKGRLFVLMNGACFSSTADLIADLKKTTDAIFIGEESGGAFEGPTGGSEIVIKLPNSKIMVRISPNIHEGFLYQKHPIGRGVLATYPVKYTVQDILQHTDIEMELAKKLIRDEKK